MKTCRRCGEIKDRETEFYKNSLTKDGFRGVCRLCCLRINSEWQINNADKVRLNQRRWVAKNPDKVRAQSRLRTRQCKWGLTAAEWDRKFEAQGSKCAICERQIILCQRPWHTDHCHVTSKLRGILCANCNPALGGFQDDPAILRRAAEYIEYYQRLHEDSQ